MNAYSYSLINTAGQGTANKSIPVKTLIGLKTQMLSPVNLYMFLVYCMVDNFRGVQNFVDFMGFLIEKLF